MDLMEQNRFAEELGKFIERKLKGKEYHLIVSIANEPGKGFSFTISTLTEQSQYKALSAIMSGAEGESDALMNKFKLPPNTKINKPVEPKW